MSLVKTSLLSGIAVVVKVASALVINKILAVFVGPAGYAVIGQFQNAVSIFVSLAGGVVATGVTKATAQHFDEEAKQHAVWQTAIRFSLLATIMVAIPLMLMSESMARWLLHRADMSSVFVWVALTLPAMAVNNLLLAIVNGKKDISVYVIANIIGSLISMVLVGLLAFKFGLYGTLVAFVISPACVLIVTAVIVARRHWFKTRFLWGQLNRPALRELSGFALMGLTSALTAPISYMFIRNYLTTCLGLSAAGYWQASWKISEIYLMMVTTTLSVYYLPRIAEIRSAIALKTEIVKIYSILMPVVALSAMTIYLLRDHIIYALFTPDFSPMRELFQWQLAGDVIKIGSWVLAYIMLGRGMVKVFVITEVTFSILFYLFSWVLIPHFGLVGVSMAYTINYTLYWVAIGYIVWHEMQQMTG